MKRFMIACCFVLLLSAPSYAFEKMHVGFLNIPPLFEMTADNKPSGLMYDLTVKILDKAGIDYDFNAYPPKRHYQNLATGITNITMGIKGVPVYDNEVLYSKDPISNLELMLFTKGETPQIKDIKDLIGKSVIVISAYSYGGMIDFLRDPNNHITIDEAVTHETAFKKLKAGRAEYLLEYKQPAEITLKSVPIDDIKSQTLKKIDFYLIVTKKTPDAGKILEALEKAFSEIK